MRAAAAAAPIPVVASERGIGRAARVITRANAVLGISKRAGGIVARADTRSKSAEPQVLDTPATHVGCRAHSAQQFTRQPTPGGRAGAPSSGDASSSSVASAPRAWACGASLSQAKAATLTSKAAEASSWRSWCGFDAGSPGRRAHDRASLTAPAQSPMCFWNTSPACSRSA